MESNNPFLSFFSKVSNKTTLGISASALFSLMLIRYMKAREHKELKEFEDKREEQIEKIKEHEDEFLGVMGVFDYQAHDGKKSFP